MPELRVVAAMQWHSALLWLLNRVRESDECESREGEREIRATADPSGSGVVAWLGGQPQMSTKLVADSRGRVGRSVEGMTDDPR